MVTAAASQSRRSGLIIATARSTTSATPASTAEKCCSSKRAATPIGVVEAGDRHPSTPQPPPDFSALLIQMSLRTRPRPTAPKPPHQQLPRRHTA